MPKAVSLYMPHWSTDLILRRSSSGRGSAGRREPPVLLFVETAGRQLVARCCDQALAGGVRPGMTVAHARALLQGRVMVRSHQPARELEALGALARWAVRFSPIVAVDPPDGLLIDISGCGRLFGGEGRLIDRIAAAVRGLGFRGRIAAAPSFACAWAVARFGPEERAIVGERARRRALQPLPVAALRIEESVVAALGEVGVDRIGHLLDLPRASLALRFGPELLRRLDQAMGGAPETIDPVRPGGPPVVERVFAGPVTQLEAITRATRDLLAELSRLLEERQSGARRLVMRVDRPDAEAVSVTIALSRPSRDVKHLWSLLSPRMESIHLGWGVERLRLEATRLGRLPHREEEWVWGAPPGGVGGVGGRDPKRLDRDLGELLDTLSNRLGPDRVVRVEPVETHLPERAFRLRPATEEINQVDFPPGKSTWLIFPSLLLARPEPISVVAMTPEGPPSWFRWRGVEQRITASAGPERIAAEWWNEAADVASPRKRSRKAFGESYARAYERFWTGKTGTGKTGTASNFSRDESDSPAARREIGGCPSFSTRDYFKVQDEHGRWLWIYHVLEHGGWFIHGLWA